MKVLLVTGKLAYGYVVEVAESVKRELKIDVDILELPLHVAAMINAHYLLKELPQRRDRLRGVDVIIVPGYAEGDMSKVSQVLGIPVLKGPRNIYDLPLMIKALLAGVGFSPIEPADSVLRKYAEKAERELLVEVKARAWRNKAFTIKEIPVSPDYPLVIFEVYASRVDDLERYVEVSKYADVISLGFPYEFNVEEAVKIVEYADEFFKKPIGVDTADLNLVVRVSNVVDFINGVLVENVEELAKYSHLINEKPVVIVANGGSPRERVEMLKKSVTYLKEKGFEKIVVDPVLMPPLQGLAESLEAYILVKREMPDTPVLMGVGNVTELTDVDSIGLNALLAFIGVELGIELYLTVEASTKTRKSVKELRKALDMAVLARELKKPPKDLSIDLLVAKSKRKTTVPLPRAKVIIRASERLPFRHDPRGYFKIAVNHEKEEIIVQHYEQGSLDPALEILSVDPYAILAEVVKRNLASLYEHYFYLGYELAKANIALKIGKEYEQDKELF